jgi:GTP-binding protein
VPNYRNTTFFKSASNIDQCPVYKGKEVAFAGRSNVGKSSALNALTGVNKLARTSKTPGRTQLINYFQVALDRFLVDLPGYGYAKVSTSIKNQWQQNMSFYLEHRIELSGLILLTDIRHQMKPFDEMMLNWSVSANLPLHILLTKADKLTPSAARKECQQLQNRLANYELISVQLFSSTKRQGIEQLSEKLNQLLS